MQVTTSSINPLFGTKGNANASILVVLDAPGVGEYGSLRQPFSGAAFGELLRILFEAGINQTDCLFTYLTIDSPQRGEMESFLYPNSDKKAPILKGIKAQPNLSCGVAHLNKTIAHVRPRLVIAVGNWALWALTNGLVSLTTVKGYRVPAGVNKWRGSQLWTEPLPDVVAPLPLLPIIHPATILRSWDYRNYTVHDLRARAVRYLKNITCWAEPEHKFNHKPTYYEAAQILDGWLKRLSSGSLELSIDIETFRRSFIACIGLADEGQALCIPLFYFGPDGQMKDYWSTKAEALLMQKLRKVMLQPTLSIIGQNYNYDVQYFIRHLSIHAPVAFDTMLMHHVLWPGTPKSLDHLASLYLNHYIYWKDESQEWDTALTHEDLWLYNCKDVRATYDIAQELKKQVSTAGMQDQYAFQLEQWALATAMSMRGTKIDMALRNNFNLELFNEANKLSAWLLACMPEACRYAPSGKPWFSSPTFSMDILYNQIGLPPQLHKKTKRPSLDSNSIGQLKAKTPWLKPMFENLETLRSISVFRSHFLEAPITYDNRIHCSFNVGGTSTFRWSSNSNSFGEGTNLQNIPKGEE